MVSQWLRRKDSYSHDRFLPLCLFIVGRCKKVHLVAPLSLRPRARQRIVISFYPQAANSSPRAGRAKCERRLRRKTKPKPGTLQNGSRPLACYHTTRLPNFGRYHHSMQNVCLKSDSSQPCVKYAKRAKCTKMCPILAEVEASPCRNTRAPEEAFEFKARQVEKWGRGD